MNYRRSIITCLNRNVSVRPPQRSSRSFTTTIIRQTRTTELLKNQLADIKVDRDRLWTELRKTCEWGKGERWGEYKSLVPLVRDMISGKHIFLYVSSKLAFLLTHSALGPPKLHTLASPSTVFKNAPIVLVCFSLPYPISGAEWLQNLSIILYHIVLSPLCYCIFQDNPQNLIIV